MCIHEDKFTTTGDNNAQYSDRIVLLLNLRGTKEVGSPEVKFLKEISNIVLIVCGESKESHTYITNILNDSNPNTTLIIVYFSPPSLRFNNHPNAIVTRFNNEQISKSEIREKVDC